MAHADSRLYAARNAHRGGIACRAGVQCVVGKAPVQQGSRRRIARVAVCRAHDDADQCHAVALRRCRHAESGFGSGAGLQPITAPVKAHQSVCVGQTEGAVPHRIHPRGAESQNLLVADQLPRHDGNIPRRGDVVFRRIVQSVGVFKHGILHAKLRGALIHVPDESFLTARDRFGKRQRGVVGGGDYDAFD